MKRIVFIFWFSGLFAIESCKKLIQPDAPVNLLSRNEVFDSDASAIGVVNSIYVFMSQQLNFSQGLRSMGVLTGLAGDELQGVPNDPFGLFYRNSITPETFLPTYFWADIYTNIYTCNVVLEELPSAAKVTAPVKKQLLAEVKFMRSLLYFYLVNIFGDVPLTTSSDYRINNTLMRTPISQVYNFILKDLSEATTDLSSVFVDGFGKQVSERVRPSKWAASALLARVYLFLKDWANAEVQATLVINNPDLVLEPDLNKVFLSTSKEAMLQLQPDLGGQNTAEGATYITSPGSRLSAFSNPASLRPSFVALFDSADGRRTKWIGKSIVPASGMNPATTYLYPFKYKLKNNPPTTTEFLMVLRLAEQYLIRAEARAQRGNLTGANDDLNKIRARAGLTNVQINNSQAILIAVARERQLEFFTEWGHRWFDLKRTGAIDTVMNRVAAEKGTTWQPKCQLFPIPQTEIMLNHNLSQNPGY